ncbi:hypothetical protein BC830DRAFT_760100 [Chytriomyces sp. MP71]|nr:hypothetical protein BC830DRAFT_760100 [Chytriomyces sp. MP71]
MSSMDLSDRDWLFAKVALCITGIGIMNNATVVLSNFWYLRKLPPSSFLIVCLCLSDTLLLANYFTISATRLVRKNLFYDSFTCQIQAFMITFGALNSLGTCAGLTLFRYLIIVHQYKVKRYFAIAYIATVACVCASVASIPFMIRAADRIYIMNGSNINCSIGWFQSADVANRAMSWTCVAVLGVPFSSIGFAYFQIYRKVSEVFGGYKSSVDETRNQFAVNDKKSASAYNSNQKTSEQFTEANHIQDTSRALTVPAAQKLNYISVSKRTEEEERQMALLIQSIVIVSVFILGWTPYLVFALIEMITGTKGDRYFEFAAEMILSLQDGINPIVVICFDQNIRANVLRGLRLSKKEGPI